MRIFHLLHLIYLNRYRKLTYSDESRLYILLGLYGVGLYYLFTGEMTYKTECIYFIFIAQSINVLQRNDYSLLKKQIGYRRTHALIALDVLICNFPLLLYWLWAYPLHFTMVLGGGLILPFILCFRKISIHTVGLFHVFDPLWNTHIRTKPLEYFILVFSLFIQYQGVHHHNEGLHFAGLFIIYFLILQIYSTKESLYFYKFSKMKAGDILLNLLKYNILNYLYIIIPSFVLSILYLSKGYVWNVFYFLFTLPLLFWMRFIFFRNDLFKGIGIMILIFVLIANRLSPYCSLYENLIMLFVAHFLLYFLSKNKLKRLMGKS